MSGRCLRWTLALSAVLWLAILLSVKAFAADPVCGGSLQVEYSPDGKVPLAFFVDATNACTDADTSEPIHDLTYCFEIDGGVTGSHDSWGKLTPKDKFCGAPTWGGVITEVGDGSHRITVTAIDATGGTASITADITVAEFTGAETYCFQNGAAPFTGCPAGASTLQTSDFDAAMGTCLTADKRCLFHSGDSFEASGSAGIGTSDVHVGSYDDNGTPGASNFTVTDAGTWEFVFDITVFGVDNIRLSDVTFAGGGGGEHAFVNIPHGTTHQVDNLLVYSNTVSDARIFIADILNTTDGANVPVLRAVVENDFSDDCAPQQNCVFTGCDGCLLIGNKFNAVQVDDQSRSHLVRIQHTYGCFIHNNLFDRGGTHNLTIRQVPDGLRAWGDEWSENCMVSDNKFIGVRSIILEWGVTGSGLPDPGKGRNIIVERNFFVHSCLGENDPYATGDTQACARPAVQEMAFNVGDSNTGVTVRNNIAEYTNVGNGTRMVNGGPGNMRVYNNSAYQPSNGYDGYFCRFCGSKTCRNNLFWTDGVDATPQMFTDGACAVTSNNYDNDGGETGVSDVGSSCTDAFTTCPPTQPSHFEPANATPPRGSSFVGTPIVCDYNQLQWNDDVGAIEAGATEGICVAAVGPAPPGGDLAPRAVFVQ